MFGDPLPLDRLFPADGDGPIDYCELRMIALTGKGVASYTYGKLNRSQRHAGGIALGPGAMTGACIAAFNDRTYEVERTRRDVANAALFQDNTQMFSVRDVDLVFVTVSGPHRMQDSEFTLALRFGTNNAVPMQMPASRNGNFLMATSPASVGGQTTFSLVFLEAELNPR